MEGKKEKKSSFFLRVFVVLFIVLTSFISWAIFQQVNKKKEIQSEISKLQDEAEKISRKNISAQERMAYLSSPEYQELEAKDKLNLKNPNENVVIVNPSVEKYTTIENSVSFTPIASKKSDLSNPLKWWHYFTKN